MDIVSGDRATHHHGMADPRQLRGREAEDAAAAYLARAGLAVVDRNVRFRAGELDLVCRDGARWVFVEVKARRADWGDAPGAAGAGGKQRRIGRAPRPLPNTRGPAGAPPAAASTSWRSPRAMTAASRCATSPPPSTQPGWYDPIDASP